jgi:hypothetical protein
MAAGLGFKTFTTGEVLTAGDVNGYLMQGINVFASSAARAAAITSPQEGQYSFLKDTNALEYYDGAAWVGAPVGDITAVTAGTGISGGGSSGDVTITNSMATAIDAKGDLIGGTGADTFSRLAVGANDTVLTADSTAATGLKWATPSSAATFRGVQVYKSGTNQTVNNATNTLITWNSENFDSDGYHDNSTNNERLTVPAGLAGKYYIYYNYQLYCNATTAITRLYKNGVQIQLGNFQTVGGGIENTMQLYLAADLVATDYIEAYVYQAGGAAGSINASAGASYSSFGMYRVGV